MANPPGGPAPGQPADAPEAGQEPVVAHAADRAVQQAQPHEAPDFEPESIDESDAGDSNDDREQ